MMFKLDYATRKVCVVMWVVYFCDYDEEWRSFEIEIETDR